MTIIGSFDPSTEDRPSGSVSGSPNLVANSSAELSNPATAVGDFDLAWSTEQARTGAYSTKVTVDTSNAGTNAWLYVPVSCPGGANHYASVHVYVAPGSPLIGQTINLGYTTALTPPGATFGFVFAAGWQRIAVNLVSNAANYLWLGVPVSSTLTNGGVFYVDDWQCSLDSGPLDDWQPANGEPFFFNDQRWVSTGDDTFQGQAVTTGDILTVYDAEFAYSLDSEVSWAVTPIIANVAEALQVKPLPGHGIPLGMGDWRVAVEILLPEDATSRWGIAKWGESRWGGIAWFDLTPYVRGAEWFRGAAQFAGRPEVGVLDFTLANEDRQFSPWNGVTAWNNATVIDDAGIVQPGYFAPGTIVRVVAFSPSGSAKPLTDPPGINVVIDDEFDTFDGAVWQEVFGTGPSGSISGGVITFDGASSEGIETIVAPSLSDATLTFKLTEYPTDAFFGFGDYDEGFFISGGTWFNFVGSFTPEGLWFRIRDDGTASYYETSADGVTWVTHATDAPSGLSKDVRAYPSSGTLKIDSITLTYPTGTVAPDSPDSWVPQFTGVVESWADETVGVGADSFVNVTVVETISVLASIDDNALLSVVGNDDQPAARIQRLIDAVPAWRYGDVMDDFYEIDPFLTATDYRLQSTDMAANRITEVYLTADSTGTVVRTDRSGALTIYMNPETNVSASGIKRGPEKVGLVKLSPAYNIAGEFFEAPYVADSVKVANDDESIVNEVRLTYVGGLERSDSDELSVRQYGARPYTRSDLICKDNDLLDHLIEKYLAARARRPLRITSLQLHSSHEATLPAIIALDVHDVITVVLPPLPGYQVISSGNSIDSLTHRLTPLNGAEPIWTVDVTFGIQSGIENNPI